MVGARPGWFLFDKHLELGECILGPMLLFVSLGSDVMGCSGMVIGQCVHLLSRGDGRVVMSFHVLHVRHQHQVLAVVWFYAESFAQQSFRLRIGSLPEVYLHQVLAGGSGVIVQAN